jgi:hypothetical protein
MRHTVFEHQQELATFLCERLGPRSLTLMTIVSHLDAIGNGITPVLILCGEGVRVREGCKMFNLRATHFTKQFTSDTTLGMQTEPRVYRSLSFQTWLSYRWAPDKRAQIFKSNTCIHGHLRIFSLSSRLSAVEFR